MSNWFKTLFVRKETAPITSTHHHTDGEAEQRKRKLEAIIIQTVADITDELHTYGMEYATCLCDYNGIGTNPNDLDFWIRVGSDIDKNIINQHLLNEFKKKLADHGYPRDAVEQIYMRAESRETVDRESQGHWLKHIRKYRPKFKCE